MPIRLLPTMPTDVADSHTVNIEYLCKEFSFEKKNVPPNGRKGSWYRWQLQTNRAPSDGVKQQSAGAAKSRLMLASRASRTR